MAVRRVPAALLPAYARRNWRPSVAPPRPPAPPAPPPLATPAPPPPPAPLPVSYGQQAGIDAYGNQIGALPGIYNPKRLSIYAEGARNLTDQGLYDTATADVAGTGADGTVTYKILTGPDGRAYRQAYQSIGSSANARGTLFGSNAQRDTAQAQTSLNNQRDAYLRGLAGQQDATTADQASQLLGLSGQRSTAEGNYADWQAQQMVAPPAPPSQAAAAVPPPPAGGTARWRVKPKGFATVKRGGWWVRP